MSNCAPPASFAATVVSNAYERFTNLANQTYTLALGATDQLGGFAINPVAFNASFNFEDALTSFQRPTRPEVDFEAFRVNAPPMPVAPEGFQSVDIALTPAPTFDVQAPELRQIPAPERPDIVAPGDAPRFDPVVMPDRPEFELPPLPTLETLNLPAAPDIQLPVFAATAPEYDVPELNEVWSFEPQAYVSQMLDTVKGRLGSMLAGGTGLPEPIERALFQRGRARLDEEAMRATQQVYGEFASRGWSEPNGMLASRVDQITQNSQNRAADLNRDVVIQVHNVEIENLRFAVQQGIALETAFAGLHLEEQRLMLAAAQFLRDSSIAVLNARIAVFNARLQAYQTEASVFTERVRAELAKAEVYRAEIEGARVRGEINEQRVRLYGEQVRTVGVLADVYRTQVQAVQAEVETNTQRIEAFRAEVQAYSERWRAHVSEWEGYRAGIDAEGRRADVYGTLAQAFATRVGAWDREQNVKIERERLRIGQHDQRLRVWDGELRRVLALLETERTRVGAVAQGANAVAQLYAADASVSQAESAAHDRTFELGLRREEARVNVDLRQGEIRIQENIQLLTLLARTRETLAQVFSQLSASTMSAINFSASVGSSTSQSASCSTSFNYSGEIADAPGA